GKMQKGGNNLIKNFKKMFKIHSPSRLMQGFGENIIQGLANGLKDSSATTQMHEVFGDLTYDIDLFKIAYKYLEECFKGGDWIYVALSDISGEDNAKRAVDIAAAMGEELHCT